MTKVCYSAVSLQTAYRFDMTKSYCLMVLVLAIFTPSFMLAYDVCLPAFEGDKYASNKTLEDIDMGIMLIRANEIFKSPNKKDSINQVEPEGNDCADHHHLCWHWALGCQCQKNPGYMNTFCALSCGICGACQDTVSWCEIAVRNNYRYCYTQPLFALNMCRRTCRMCRGDCYDHHVRCQEWARKGACPKNPHYMLRYCMKSCQSCN